MTAQEAYKNISKYSSSFNNCCWFVEKCVDGVDCCSKDRQQCEYYQTFLKVRKELKILEILEKE